MNPSTLTRTLAAGAAVGFACVFVLAAPAQAEKKGRSIQSEAEWVAYDAAGQTITLKIKDPGRDKRARVLKKNKEASFNVKAEGSILTRTSVAINGMKGELTDIPAGKTVNVYWVPDDSKSEGRFARKIDVIFSEEELNARYPEMDE